MDRQQPTGPDAARSYLRSVVEAVDDDISQSSVPSLIIDKQVRKLLLERFDLWTITNLNVGILRIVERVILVVVLGSIEAFQRRNFGDDPSGKHLRIVELRDISSCNPLLVVINIEDCGPI